VNRFIRENRHFTISEVYEQCPEVSLVQLCTKLSPNIYNTAKFVQAAFWYEEGINKLVSRYDKRLSVQDDYVEK